MSADDPIAPVDGEVLRQRIRLYLYGELSLAERQEVERFRDTDPAFRALFDEERAFLLGLSGDDIGAEVDALLGGCREGLILAVADEEFLRGRLSLTDRIRGGLRAFLAALEARPLAWQPALAVLLLVAGFLAGRGSGPEIRRSPGSLLPDGPGLPASFDGGPDLTGIETVRLDPAGGNVQIVLEERRVVTGPSSDPLIRGILLEGLHESHAGARLSSLDALRGFAFEADVRRTMLRSMLEDDNPGVRLKALDAVREQADHPEVREALVRTLRKDPVEGMRVHAIQLLSRNPSRDLAGALQELVELERNPFVLQESERILDALGASMERF